MTRDELHELAAAYSIGALDGEDLARFETLLRAADAAALAALQDCDEAVTDLAAEFTAPAADTAILRERVMAAAQPVAARESAAVIEIAAVRERPARQVSSGFQWTPFLAGALAAGIAVIIGGYPLVAAYRAEVRKLADEASEMSSALARAEKEQTRLAGELARQRQLLEMLAAPDTQTVALKGLDPSPKASGRMIFHAGTGGRFVARGLPSTPAGKVYELWAIPPGGKPVPAGTFAVDEDGGASIEVPKLPGVDGPVAVFAVTLEPEGGLPAPSGAMFLAGKGS